MNFYNYFYCNCSIGYFGDYCELEIDECLLRLCFNNGICFDVVNSFICLCVDGYIGKYCEYNIDDCVNVLC